MITHVTEDDKVYPGLHEHEKEPAEFRHNWSQGLLSLLHSSVSSQSTNSDNRFIQNSWKMEEIHP